MMEELNYKVLYEDAVSKGRFWQHLAVEAILELAEYKNFSDDEEDKLYEE